MAFLGGGLTDWPR